MGKTPLQYKQQAIDPTTRLSFEQHYSDSG